MLSLRQRLLLVAGWVVAAVATGLVSAGAVAVAGGQVSDRPLRPLSVAEVAALPGTIEDPCTVERLASGGLSSSRCPDREHRSNGPTVDDDAAVARPAEKEVPVDPAPAVEPAVPREDLSASPDDSFARSPLDVEVPPLAAPVPTEPRVVDLRGGRVSVSLLGGAIILNSATPRYGYHVEHFSDRSDELTVTFFDGRHLSALVVSVVDERLDLDFNESDL